MHQHKQCLSLLKTLNVDLRGKLPWEACVVLFLLWANVFILTFNMNQCTFFSMSVGCEKEEKFGAICLLLIYSFIPSCVYSNHMDGLTRKTIYRVKE